MKTKQWIVYGTLLFIIFLGLVELGVSFAFFSMFSPTTSALFLTPVGFFAPVTVAGIVSMVYLLLLYYVLSGHVFKYDGKTVTYNKEKAIYLLPFYLISGVSLSVHLAYTPIRISHVFSFVFFVVFAESCYEYLQVVDLRDVTNLDVRSIGKTLSTASIFLVVLIWIMTSGPLLIQAQGEVPLQSREDSEDGEIGVGTYPTKIDLDLPRMIEAGDELELSADRVAVRQRIDNDDRELTNVSWMIEHEGSIVEEGEAPLVYEFEEPGTYTVYMEAECDYGFDYYAQRELEAEEESILDILDEHRDFLFGAVLLSGTLVAVVVFYQRKKRGKPAAPKPTFKNLFSW